MTALMGEERFHTVTITASHRLGPNVLSVKWKCVPCSDCLPLFWLAGATAACSQKHTNTRCYDSPVKHPGGKRILPVQVAVTCNTRPGAFFFFFFLQPLDCSLIFFRGGGGTGVITWLGKGKVYEKFTLGIWEHGCATCNKECAQEGFKWAL